MIDAVDLPLVEHLGNRVVDHPGAGQVAADRLLDDQPRKRPLAGRSDEFRFREVLDRRDEHRWRHGEVVDAIAGKPALVLDDVEPRSKRRERLRIVERRGDEVERVGERPPHGFVRRPPREMRDAILREVAIGLVGHVAATDADHREARRQQAVDVQVVERGQELAVREIAAAAEDHQRDRLRGDRRRHAGAEPGEDRIVRRAHGGAARHALTCLLSSRRVRRTDCAARRAAARRTGCGRASESA